MLRNVEANWTKIRFKAQTRFWGYDLRAPESDREFTSVALDPSNSIHDSFASSDDPGPIAQQRTWDQEAEDNLSAQLEQIGLLSPAGEVDKALQTVLNNIKVTNHLSLEPQVHCRVLLTSNLESAVVGHTIIVSRGLIDVLPNEAALAAVLAHDLALVTFGNRAFTKFAWPDQLHFAPRDVIRKLRFVPSADEDERASSLAREWMLNSPYRDSLDTVAQFTEELHSVSPHIGQLLQANIGDSLSNTLAAERTHVENAVLKASPEIHALPLGSRIQVDPWTNELTLLKVPGTEQRSKSESMPFAVTPFFPYLRHAHTALPPESASLSNWGNNRRP